MFVELLYFDGCPNHGKALQLVQQVLREEGARAEIRTTNVRSEREARALRFIGSPSVRVDGKDVDPQSDRTQVFGRRCRVYVANGTLSGVPSLEDIRRAVQGAAKRQESRPGVSRSCSCVRERDAER